MVEKNKMMMLMLRYCLSVDVTCVHCTGCENIENIATITM